MNISEDGTVTGSIDHAQLAEVEPKTDEARQQVEALQAAAAEGQAQTEADARRLAEAAAAQDPNLRAGDIRDNRDPQGRSVGVADDSADADPDVAPAQPQQTGEAVSTTEADPAGEDVDQLRAEAEALGVKVDRRWGADRLRSEVDAAREG